MGNVENVTAGSVCGGLAYSVIQYTSEIPVMSNGILSFILGLTVFILYPKIKGIRLNKKYQNITAEFDKEWENYFQQHAHEQNIDEESLELFRTSLVQKIPNVIDDGLERKLFHYLEHKIASFRMKIKTRKMDSEDKNLPKKGMEFEKIVKQTLIKTYNTETIDNSNAADFSFTRNGVTTFVEAKLVDLNRKKETIRKTIAKWEGLGIEYIGYTELKDGIYITGRKFVSSDGSEYQFA